MTNKKLIRKVEKRLMYLIKEALNINVTDPEWVLHVISEEFFILTGINIDAWITGQDTLSYTSTGNDHISVKCLLNAEKPKEGEWFGSSATMFYKEFHSSPCGRFYILLYCNEEDGNEFKNAISALTLRIFNKIKLWFNMYDLKQQHNLLELPSPCYFNCDWDSSYSFYYYRGAVYLKLEDANEAYEFDSKYFIKQYNYWMSYFEDDHFFSPAFDAGCLVILLKKDDSSVPYTMAEYIIKQIEENTKKEEQKPLWAMYYNAELSLTMKDLGDLRLKVLSGISGAKYHMYFGAEYPDIEYGTKKEPYKTNTYDYWEALDDKKFEECTKAAFHKPEEPHNPFEDCFD